jgi:hypothetical protein
MNTQEKYTPLVLGVSSTTVVPGASSIGSFLAVTAGTITLTKLDGTVVLNAFPVAAGQVAYINLRVGHSFTVTLAGGASGTLGVTN